VRWPAATRLIPAAANSIRVDILRGDAILATELLTRPAVGATTGTTAAFANLPVETLTARATAYPRADGGGVAQAVGGVSVAIRAGETVPVTLTMNSTIDRVEITPAAPPALVVGQQTQLSPTARDTAGNVVLVASGSLRWESGDPATVRVDANGWLTALSAGTVTITVTETESGKAASVTVVSARPADPFAGVRQFLNLDPDNPPNYANPAFPVHYDAQARARDNAPADNPVTDRGATLGRVLFFDRRLSRNDTVSCASCHQPGVGMTDPRRFSVGFSGNEFTTAHSMRLGNIRFYAGREMFWDRRAASVEAQATQPIRNEVEMGFDDAHGGFAAVIAKMQTLPYYPELFRHVYGDPAITEDRIQRALAQFERAMVSVNSRFDAGFAQVYNPADPQRGVNTPFPNYTAREERGKALFLRGPGQGGAGCATCHQIPTFALDSNSRSNGLDAGETRIFKSPSLKNVALTGPYMHDGRFQTLEQVVDFYIRGIQNGPALDNRLKNPQGQPQRLNLTPADRDDLVAFLQTLNDPVLLADPKFGNPFVQ
jgi:cytochrome c peroxidase